MKRLSLFIISFIFCSSMTLISLEAKDFDFDEFFRSLFEDDDSSDAADTPVQTSKATEPAGSLAKPSDVRQVVQSISTTKKENFLESLKFAPDEEGKQAGKPFKIKVPESKRKAFEYYMQKMLDFIFVVRSSLDVGMRDELVDFMSLGDSITSEVLSINRQYLMRAFYHKDFENLRRKIYSTLTKKSDDVSLRSVMIALQEIAQEKQEDGEGDDDRLTFEQDDAISATKRAEIIKDLKVVSEKDLKPILDDLRKVVLHSYAVEEKQKKTDVNKRMVNKGSRGGVSRPSVINLRSGSGRRGGASYRPTSSGYGRGGYSGGYGGQGSSGQAAPQGAPSPTPSQSPSGTVIKDKEKAEEKKQETAEERFEVLLNGLLKGFGKEITESLYALNKLPSVADHQGRAAEEYLFNKALQKVIAHQYTDEYLKGFKAVDGLYKQILVSPQKKSSEKTTSEKEKQEGQKKEIEKKGLSAEQRKLYTQFLALKKAALIGFVRAINSFCSLDGYIKIPQVIVEKVTFSPPERLKLFEQVYNDIAALYPDEAKKVEGVLEKQIVACETSLLKKHEVLCGYLQGYADIFSKYQFDDEKKADEINRELKGLIHRPEYVMISIMQVIKDLPLAKSTAAFGVKQDWKNITVYNADLLLHYLDAIHRLQWGIVKSLYVQVVDQFPTKNISKNFLKMQDVVKKYTVNRAVNNQVRNHVIVPVMTENPKEKERFEKDSQLFDKTEEMQKEIEKTWKIGLDQKKTDTQKQQQGQQQQNIQARELYNLLNQEGGTDKFKSLLQNFLAERPLTKEDLEDED